MEMPKPDENHARFDRLIGTWTGDETMPPSAWVPEEIVATARVVNRKGAAGFVMCQDYEQRRGDEVTFAGHGVFWIGSSEGEVRLHWWDAMGMSPDEFHGGWDGDRLVLVAENAMGRARGTWVIGDGTYEHRMEMSKGGELWNVVMHGVYRRE